MNGGEIFRWFLVINFAVWLAIVYGIASCSQSSGDDRSICQTPARYEAHCLGNFR